MHASIPIQKPGPNDGWIEGWIEGWELIEGADDGSEVEVEIEVGSKDGGGGQGRPQTDGQTLLAGSRPLGPLCLCLHTFFKSPLFLFFFSFLASHPQVFSFPFPVLMFLRKKKTSFLFSPHLNFASAVTMLEVNASSKRIIENEEFMVIVVGGRSQ